MLKQLKKIFTRGDRSTCVPAALAGGPRPDFRPVSKPFAPPAWPPGLPVEPIPEADNGGEDISIPLQTVLSSLPADLKRRVVPMDLGGATLTVALTKVLSQLPTGAVKLSFGELRRAAPPLFIPGDHADAQEVVLPLNELLVRINPALLPKSGRASRPGPETRESAFTAGGDDELLAFAAPARPSGGPIRVPLPAPIANVIRVPLAALAANWPAVLRAAVEQAGGLSAEANLPDALVEAGMKVGRVAFPWRTLRGWIQPALPPTLSRYDDTTLELPLEVLMPRFLDRWQQTPKAQSRVIVDETIPELFAPDVVPDFALPDTTFTALGPEATDPGNGATAPPTDLDNRYISPTEVVTRAIALPGVAGALVVLPEGLLVACRLSTTDDPDALAAFLAQAFGKVAHSAAEAQAGNVSRLEFEANNIPWLIFGLEGALLTAFGLPHGTLPVLELTALAKELERKREA